MGNYKVGDRVEAIKDYDCVRKGMKGTIKVIFESGYPRIGVEWDTLTTGHNGNGMGVICAAGKGYYVNEADVRKINAPSIHITADDNTVHAILKDGGKVIKRSKAVCAPSDMFDFETGARIAFDRLCASLAENSKFSKPQTEDKPAEPINLHCVKSFRSGEFLTEGKTYTVGKDGKSMKFDDGYTSYDIFRNTLNHIKIVPNYLVPEVKRSAKIGEWVKITRSDDDRAIEGEIYLFIEELNGNTYIKHPDGTRHPDGAANIGRSGYVVLDGYKPEPEPTAHTTVNNITINAKCTSCRRERINEAIFTPKLDTKGIYTELERILKMAGI